MLTSYEKALFWVYNYISPSPTHDRKQRGSSMNVFYSILQTTLTGSYIRGL